MDELDLVICLGEVFRMGVDDGNLIISEVSFDEWEGRSANSAMTDDTDIFDVVVYRILFHVI